MKKRKWYFNFMIICIIEVIICVGMFFAASLQKTVTQTAKMALNTVSGNIQKYVCTETLKRGSYDVTIDYSAKDDKSTYCFEADPMFDYRAVDGLLQSDVKGSFA